MINTKPAQAVKELTGPKLKSICRKQIEQGGPQMKEESIHILIYSRKDTHVQLKA